MERSLRISALNVQRLHTHAQRLTIYLYVFSVSQSVSQSLSQSEIVRQRARSKKAAFVMPTMPADGSLACLLASCLPACLLAGSLVRSFVGSPARSLAR